MPRTDRDPGLDKDSRPTFEDFTSGAEWRSLPMKIKLMVLKLLSAERDTPSKPPQDT
jgi:hypothetical protein